MAQRRVADKSNEIPALPELLAPLDLDGALITADATAHPDRHRRVDPQSGRPLPADGQGQLARSAPEAQGPALEGRADPVRPRRLPRAVGAAHPQGRPGPPVGGLPRRRPGDPGSDAPAPSTSAAAVAGRRPPRSSTRFCSLPVDQARLEAVAAWARGHWGIANRLHWIRDVVTGEDRHQLRTRNGPLISAALRNPATRPHPPLPRTPHTHHHHQSHGPTPPTSHQTTHPTTPLNRPCRPPGPLSRVVTGPRP